MTTQVKTKIQKFEALTVAHFTELFPGGRVGKSKDEADSLMVRFGTAREAEKHWRRVKDDTLADLRSIRDTNARVGDLVDTTITEDTGAKGFVLMGDLYMLHLKLSRASLRLDRNRLLVLLQKEQGMSMEEAQAFVRRASAPVAPRKEFEVYPRGGGV
jgi:hypothetical protein